MDAGTTIAIVTGIAGVVGGFFGGRRMSNGDAVSTAVDVVELLRIQVASLTTKGEEKDTEIADLKARVDVLESLVTQRAEVEVVRHIVERIAEKVDA